MAITLCSQCGEKLIEGHCDCVANCTNCNNVCKSFLDTDCVYYNYGHPEWASDLVCLGLPSNTSLTTIIKAIDSKLCTAILVEDTYSIDLTLTGNVLTGNVRIDPASTLPYSIGPAGIKLDCCDPELTCEDVEYELLFDLNPIVVNSTFYDTLDPLYFVKSQYLTSVGISDGSSMSGANLTYLKYINYFSNTVYVTQTLGGVFQMPLGICGNAAAEATGQFILEMATSPYCKFFLNCSLTAPRVDYSERYLNPGCINPQIGDVYVYNNWLYFIDNGPSGEASVIRRLNINTLELRTLSGGDITLLPTVTNSLGNATSYDGLMGLNLDINELVNGEPVIYTVSYAGIVCRVVRETNNQCDERANWKTYIIAGATAVGDVLGAGDVARFNTPNGIKRIGYYNLCPILGISDAGNGKIKFMYLASGNKNIAASWTVAEIPTNADPVLNAVDAVGFALSLACNFNYDLDTDTFISYYESGGNTFICITPFTGNTTVPSDFLSASSYSTRHNAMKNTATYSGTPALTPGDGLSAQIRHPFFVSKITSSLATFDGDLYVFTETLAGIISSSYLNGFYRRNGAPTDPTDYWFIQPIATNVNAIGAIGSFAAAAHAGCSGFYPITIGATNTILDITTGGFRVWDFNTTFSITSVFSGGAIVAATGTVNNASNFMDTQYELTKTCS